jgi:vesicle transport through interaction with t-SNAREs protein 1
LLSFRDKTNSVFNSSMDPVRQYEDDFRDLAASIQRRISSLTGAIDDARLRTISEAEKEITEADSVLRSMDRDLRGAARQKAQPKIQSMQDELAQLRATLRKQSSQGASFNARSELLGSGSSKDSDLDLEFGNQRNSILAANQMAANTKDRLLNTERVMMNAHATGIEVGNTLAKDRDTLMRAEDKLVFADERVDDTRRTLRNMSRRVVTNKLMLIAIILILLGGIALVLYLDWRPAPSTAAPTSAPTHAPTPAPTTNSSHLF